MTRAGHDRGIIEDVRAVTDLDRAASPVELRVRPDEVLKADDDAYCRSESMTVGSMKVAFLEGVAKGMMGALGATAGNPTGLVSNGDSVLAAFKSKRPPSPRASTEVSGTADGPFFFDSSYQVIRNSSY